MQDEVQVDEKRAALVKELIKMVQEDLSHWKYAFDRMKRERAFVRGLQWDGTDKKDLNDPDRKYVANITLSHIRGKTAATYARNPKYIYRKSKRMHNQLWDGTAAQLQTAQMAIEAGLDRSGSQVAIIQEAIESQQSRQMFDKMGETLTILYEYFIREQIHPTKTMMKRTVKSSLTVGVGYIKQTFQRAMGLNPDTERAIADSKSELDRIERLALDLEEGEILPEDGDAERLRLMIAQLESQEQIILREGLALDYPDSLNIIPDKKMTYLPEFLGCGHVTEQYIMDKTEVQETFGVTLRGKDTSARKNGDNSNAANDFVASDNNGDNENNDTVTVWQIWNKAENLVYTVCQGYDDFLVDPAPPDVYTERFWPWYAYAPNATDDDEDPFPPSDVFLIEPMQSEINRSGESLRQHRYAARPRWVTGSAIGEEDRRKMQNSQAHDIVELHGMQPDEDIRKRFQPFPASPIDQNLYTTAPAFGDIQRTVGSQEANLGGTSGATATETSIAESSRQSGVTSDVDELDDILEAMARAGGQILLQNMQKETVMEIVGPGAVWPDATRNDVAREIYLEVVAGSAGRPNQAQEVQIREKIMPLLFQVPGIKVESVGKDLLRVMDDSIVYEDWIDMDMLSIMAMNGVTQAQANASGGDPEAQGGEGASNAPAPPTRSPEGTMRPGQEGPS